MDRVLETFEKQDGKQRVWIVQRADGRYSYRVQNYGIDEYRGPGTFKWRDGYMPEPGWYPPGNYCGIYDSAETAKWEALGKIQWLASTLQSN
jgi:hypothetical protein